MLITLGAIHEQADIVNAWAEAFRGTFKILVKDQNHVSMTNHGLRLDRENAKLQAMVSTYKTYSPRHASSIGQLRTSTAQSIRDTATTTARAAA